VTRSNPPAVPEPVLSRLIARLALQYSALPPQRIRWRTHQGLDFLTNLQALPRTVTNQRLADAFGIQASTVSILRRKRVTWTTWPWPKDVDLRRLRRAWKAVQERRTAYRQVRPDSPQFAEMHDALHDVMTRTGVSLEILGYALEGACLDDLRRFAHPPTSPAGPSVPR
jgi:hypothetical protein